VLFDEGRDSRLQGEDAAMNAVSALALRPAARAMPREFQCVASDGTLLSVRAITASMPASSIVRGVLRCVARLATDPCAAR
jgi:hypothetical protein